MKLSILICTVLGREVKFNALMLNLQKQSAIHPDVEILFEKDNKQISVGAKRQKLIERAKGDYVVFIDDDDAVPAYYVINILMAIESKPDCIGFKIECSGTRGRLASSSNRYLQWAENQNGFDYVRTIYHKNPVRREYALIIGYQDMRFGEDAEYSKRLKESGLLIKEVYIDEIMYYYNYKPEPFQVKYGIK